MNKKYLNYIKWGLIIIGFILFIVSSIKMNHYPGYKEIRKEAFQSVGWIYYIGCGLFMTGYLGLYSKK